MLAFGLKEFFLKVGRRLARLREYKKVDRVEQPVHRVMHRPAERQRTRLTSYNVKKTGDVPYMCRSAAIFVRSR